MRAAITGVGAVTPLGVGTEALHRGWVNSVCGVRNGVGMCDAFDPKEFLSRREVRRLDRFSQLGILAGDEAIQAAWGDDLPYPPDRVACLLGCCYGGIDSLLKQYIAYEQGGSRSVWALAASSCMVNAAPAVLAIRHGFQGESGIVSSACASGAHAIGSALRMLREGEVDAAVTGGSEACVCDVVLALFRATGALSPSGVCRPFDRRRDGFVMGEGAGILVLEDPIKAESRGATVLGYVAGYGSTTDAYHLTAPVEGGETCALAMSRALADANITPDGVDWVNAHGTATRDNDRMEALALQKALGDRACTVPVSAPKSVLGHSMGAAGGVEAVSTIIALRNRVAPPTVGLEELEEGLDLNCVIGAATSLDGYEGDRPLIAISNSFAFGGHNSSLVITT